MEEFSWFYTLKSSKGNLGFYYFAKRVAKGVQAITKIKKSLGNWKETFFVTPEVDVRDRFDTPSKLSRSLLFFFRTYGCAIYRPYLSDT